MFRNPFSIWLRKWKISSISECQVSLATSFFCPHLGQKFSVIVVPQFKQVGMKKNLKGEVAFSALYIPLVLSNSHLFRPPTNDHRYTALTPCIFGQSTPYHSDLKARVRLLAKISVFLVFFWMSFCFGESRNRLSSIRLPSFRRPSLDHLGFQTPVQAEQEVLDGNTTEPQVTLV